MSIACWSRLRILIFLEIFLCTIVGAAEGSEKRVALVIGNGSYIDEEDQLKNPPNDAVAIGQKLRTLGFDVIAKTNLKKRDMELLIEEYLKQADGAGISIFYYSGHGFGIGGSNYLAPVDIKSNSKTRDLKRQSVQLEILVQRLQHAARVNLFFLDACRNDPTRSMGSWGDGEKTRDLRLKSIPQGTALVLYAAAEGKRALDGNGDNSPFAEALLSHLGDDATVQNLVPRIIGDVKNKTKNRQSPEEKTNLDQEIRLVPPKLETPSRPPTATPTPTPMRIPSLYMGPCIGHGGVQSITFWGPEGQDCNNIPVWGKYLAQPIQGQICSCLGHNGVEGVRLWGPQGQPCGGMLQWGTYSEQCKPVQSIMLCGCIGHGNMLEGQHLWGPGGERCGGMTDPRWGVYSFGCVGAR